MSPPPPPPPATPPGEGSIFTIGHSTLPLPEFGARLQAFGVQTLVDVRKIPRSSFNPQFNADALAAFVTGLGRRYVPCPGLGGLRKPAADSINLGWKDRGFRAFADYMGTAPFAAALDQLLRHDRPLAILCAEAVPWRCHRSLIADALVARGVPVWHILGAARAEPHELTSFARVDGGRLTYPPPRPSDEAGEGSAQLGLFPGPARPTT